jgi:predicted transcriptional regulator
MQRGTKIAIEMLGKGLSQVEVSRIIGCTESAISQVATSYAQQIALLSETANAVTASLDEQMEHIETLLVEKIRNAIPLETDVMKLARLFQTINGAKRRSQGEGASGTTVINNNNNNVVVLDLPQRMQKEVTYTTNPQNEVVEVNGQSLAIASTKQVEGMLAALSPKSSSVSSIENLVAAVEADFEDMEVPHGKQLQPANEPVLQAGNSGQGRATICEETTSSISSAIPSTGKIQLIEEG